MKSLRPTIQLTAFLALAAIGLGGCASGDGTSSVSGGVYYGAGFYDPWFYGSYYDDPDIIVTPPPARPPPAVQPPRPTHPIATPPHVSPRPMPSIPRAPMPRAR